MRVLGAAAVIAATAAMGFSGVWRLNRRVQVLAALTTALGVMESEICSRLTPMGDVLELLAREAPEPARPLFQNAAAGMAELGLCSFAEIWTAAVQETPSLLLTGEEAECLAGLGLCLGRYNVEEQASCIAGVRRRLERYLDAAGEQRARDGRLHAFFGVAAGLLAVIVLL